MDRAQRSNLRPQPAQSVIRETLHDAMRAYDRLPPELRNQLRNANNKFSASVVSNIHRRRGIEIAALSLLQTERKLSAGYDDWLLGEARSLTRDLGTVNAEAL